MNSMTGFDVVEGQSGPDEDTSNKARILGHTRSSGCAVLATKTDK